MKRLNFLKHLCLLALVFTVGCQADKYDANDPLSSVYQTKWSGNYTGESEIGKPLYINVAFASDTIMSFTLPQYSATCIYRREGRVIFVEKQSGGYEYMGDMHGAWWIDKLTQTELVLTLKPGSKFSKQLELTKVD